LLNPKSQVITKEELGKYINAYQEISDGRKLVIGPHIVVKGNQKNYVSFINSNLEDNPDSIYYEDAIAKAILFRTSEKIYGIKPNALGDLRYITVPYTISLLGYITDYKLNLFKIWTNQSLSPELENTLRELMLMVESFIKESAGELALYGEWAKKADCWIRMKVDFQDINLPINPDDFNNVVTRVKTNANDIDNTYYKEIEENIKSISSEKWKEIYVFCKGNEEIPASLTKAVHELGKKLKSGIRPSSKEILLANEVLNKVIYKTSIFDVQNEVDTN
jgi:hypothetical protein